jgi:hypothetical protein
MHRKTPLKGFIRGTALDYYAATNLVGEKTATNMRRPKWVSASRWLGMGVGRNPN